MVTSGVVRVLMAGTVSLAGGYALPVAALAQSPAIASAVIRDARGGLIGTAVFTEGAGGVRLALRVHGLPPGNHGVHLHAVGLCDAPDFTTAGGHLNPADKRHGLSNPNGPHTGDLPQLPVTGNGTALYNATAAMVTLDSGSSSLLDGDRSSIVIHADPDDQMTDPAGNSGSRIACGVIVPGAVALPSIAVSGVTLPATGGGSAGRGILGGLGGGTAGVLALAALCAGVGSIPIVRRFARFAAHDRGATAR